jgi:hypothetical protein
LVGFSDRAHAHRVGIKHASEPITLSDHAIQEIGFAPKLILNNPGRVDRIG